MKTIYNVYVVMDSQEQCDRMKQLCIDNGLNFWKFKDALDYVFDRICLFHYETDCNEFFVCTPYDGWLEKQDLIQVTETEFIELLKTTK